jgi:hypothetical protein
VQYSPSGSLTTSTPTFKWGVSAGATQYYFELSSATAPVFKSFYATSVCTGGICTVTPAVALTAGLYSWYVQAQSSGGKTWSNGMSFTVLPPPAPTPSSPSGAVFTPTPTYTWTVSSGATQYFLQVGNGTSTVFQSFYDAAQTCSSGTCSVTPTPVLAQGSYNWAVQARNTAGGTWSASASFTVQGPPAPTLASPSGSITNATPTYTWSAVGGGVTRYVLAVTPGDGGTAAFSISYTPAQACSGQNCSVTPANVLLAGSYTWAVRPWNTTGPGDWSAARSILVSGPPPPGPLSPTGTGTNATPTYVWTAVEGGVVSYTIGVIPVDGGTAAFEATYDTSVCAQGTCSGTPTTLLTTGSYTWQVRARNAAGPGDWSGPRAFTVTGPPVPSPLAPSGAITTPVPTFSWSAVGGNVTQYVMGVTKANGNSIYQIWYDTGVCTAGTCSVTPTTPLALGGYTWAVRGRNAAGPGDWCNPVSFTVLPPPPPALISPNGSVATQTPTFVWNASPGAATYVLAVLTPGGSTVYEVYGLSSCPGGICSTTPATALAEGSSYGWRVRGANVAAMGEWSAVMSFRIRPSTLPGNCPGQLASADFSGDGLLDQLCVVDGVGYVSLGTPTGLGTGTPWLLHVFARLLVGDFDGDGKADVGDVELQTGEFRVALSTGTAFAAFSSWGIASATAVDGQTYACQGSSLVAGTGDLNGDALTDVYCQSPANGRLFAGRSTGTAFSFSILAEPPPGLAPTQEYVYSGSRLLTVIGPPGPQ